MALPPEMPEFDESEVKAARMASVAEVRGLDGAGARNLFTGDWRKQHALLAYCGVRDLQRESEEEALARELRQELTRAGGAAPGPILAAMLLLYTHELPLPADLDAIPDWLLPDYCRFLITAPRLFQQPGDSEHYARFVGRAVALLHGYIMREPPAPLRAEVRSTFMEAANFLQLYFNELNLKDTYRQRAEIMESWLLSRGAPLAHQFAPRPQARARIRVGVLCERLYAHTETYFMLAHLERFPRERCELIFYVLSESGDAIERHAKSIADATMVLPSEDRAAVERLRGEDLDVLIIGSNATVGASRCTVLACHRLARVQVISGSSPVTTGLTSADWYASAELNETEEGARTQFTEWVYRMPGMITRYAYYHDKDPATLSPSRGELGIPEGDAVFFSGANYFKITPDLSAQWARVMAQEPRSWLVLIPFNQNWTGYLAEPFCARVLEQINAAGGDPSRVLILDPVPTRADLHRLMSCADIYLDSFPFAGACSLLDPLLVGMPVVAHAGTTFRGSVAAGMLRGLGLGDMATADADAYVSRAVALARDPALREQARRRIRAALEPRNPIFDSETASRNFESAIVDMFAQAQEGSASLLRWPAAALREAIAGIASELARSGNAWFKRLTNLELTRLLLAPYSQRLPAAGSTPQLIAGLSGETLARALADMRGRGYEAVFFSYEDRGNLKGGVRTNELIAAGFEGMVACSDAQAGGDVVFFRPDDTPFLATLLRLFLGFLPPRERERYLPLSAATPTAPGRPGRSALP
jgi:predicted O-linked N-acetylglucosamine transferase (SPINDLY family)